MSTIKQIISRGSGYVWRKMSIKRLKSNGQYEDSWLDITGYVIKWGSIMKSYGDNVLLGDYRIEGITITLDNRNRKFNRESDPDSLFSGFASRYRTKIKIEAGFYDDNDAEIPGITYFGIVYSQPETSEEGTINLDVSSMLKVFENYGASGISPINNSTKEIMLSLVKKEVLGKRIFDQFLEGVNDSERYKIDELGLSTITLDNFSVADDDTVWDKIVSYSNYEDFVPYINNSGNFVWAPRQETGTVQWIFNGAGELNNDYGVNIIELSSEKENLDDVWSKITIEHDNDQFSIAKINWTPGDTSIPDIYGERIYSKSFFELSADEAQNVANKILAGHSSIKFLWEIKTIFIPHLELNDLVQINYRGSVFGNNIFTNDISLLDGLDVLGFAQSSINLDQEYAKIIRIEIDLDNFTTNFQLKGI